MNRKFSTANFQYLRFICEGFFHFITLIIFIDYTNTSSTSARSVTYRARTSTATTISHSTSTSSTAASTAAKSIYFN
jgi:hypothetical protein